MQVTSRKMRTALYPGRPSTPAPSRRRPRCRRRPRMSSWRRRIARSESRSGAAGRRSSRGARTRGQSACRRTRRSRPCCERRAGARAAGRAEAVAEADLRRRWTSGRGWWARGWWAARRRRRRSARRLEDDELPPLHLDPLPLALRLAGVRVAPRLAKGDLELAFALPLDRTTSLAGDDQPVRDLRLVRQRERDLPGRDALARQHAGAGLDLHGHLRRRGRRSPSLVERDHERKERRSYAKRSRAGKRGAMRFTVGRRAPELEAQTGT